MCDGDEAEESQAGATKEKRTGTRRLSTHAVARPRRVLNE